MDCNLVDETGLIEFNITLRHQKLLTVCTHSVCDASLLPLRTLEPNLTLNGTTNIYTPLPGRRQSSRKFENAGKICNLQ